MTFKSTHLLDEFGLEYQVGRPLHFRDESISISRCLVPGFVGVHKFGLNSAVGAVAETIWEYGGIYEYLSAAVTLTMSSDSAADASAGSGAQSIAVSGLDANYEYISEEIITNGLTPVTSSLSYLRVYRMFVVAAGANNGNDGTIYFGTGPVGAGIPASPKAIIGQFDGIAGNQTLMSIYTIPANKTGYLYKINIAGNEGKGADIGLFTRLEGALFRIKNHVDVFQNAFELKFTFPLEIPEKTDIEIRAASAAAGAHISASFDLLLIDD